MNYYIGEGAEQRGPFTVDQLRGMALHPDTLVWHEGMPQWQPARTVAELQHLFNASPSVPPMASAAGPVSYAAAPAYAPDQSKRVMAGVLGILLGGLGIHKFVLGQTGPGLILLLSTVLTCGLAGMITHIIGLIEGIIYLSKTDAEFHQIYVVQRKAWF